MTTSFGRTLAIVKPDAVAKIGPIFNCLEENDIQVRKAKMVQLTRKDAAQFYSEHQSKIFFKWDPWCEKFWFQNPTPPTQLSCSYCAVTCWTSWRAVPSLLWRSWAVTSSGAGGRCSGQLTRKKRGRRPRKASALFTAQIRRRTQHTDRTVPKLLPGRVTLLFLHCYFIRSF